MTASQALPGRVLVVKLADLGDAVLALPAIQALRAAGLATRIDVLTTPAGAQVFRLSPAVSRVIVMNKFSFDRPAGFFTPAGALELARLALELRRGRYDAVLLLHHLTTAFGARKFQLLARACAGARVIGLDNGRGTFLDDSAEDYGFGAMTEWQYNLDVARQLVPDAVPERPNLLVPRPARSSVDDTLERLGITGRLVVVHPIVGDYAPARAWPVERFVETVRRLRSEAGLSVVIVGTDHPGNPATDWNAAGAVDLTGQTTIPELCALVERASLVIGSDSAVVHLAAALNRPFLAIFGPSNSAAWMPYGAVEAIAGSGEAVSAFGVALRSGIPCSPCLYSGYGLGRRNGCALRTCLTQIEPSTVIDHAIRILALSDAANAGS